MSEIGETFAALAEIKQTKRALNRHSSAVILTEAGFQFVSKNAGAHLLVAAPLGHVVDFWPGTGRWATRGYRFALVGRGVKHLVAHLKTAS